MIRVNHKTLLDEQNAVAHLDVLKQELVVVSDELGRARSDLDSTRKEASDIRESVRSILREAQEQARELLLQANRKLQEASDREDESYRMLASVSERINKIEKEHVARVNDLLNSHAEYEELLRNTKISIDAHQSIHKSLLDSITSSQLTLSDIHGKITQYTDLHNSTRLEYEDAVSRYNLLTEQAKQEYEKYHKLAEEEGLKVALPKQILEEENMRLELKRHDIHVYENRIREQWSRLNPGAPFNI